MPVLSNIIRDARAQASSAGGCPVHHSGPSLFIIFDQHRPTRNDTAAALDFEVCHFALTVRFLPKQPQTSSADLTVSALALFVFWILTDDSDTSLSLDYFTLLADRFYR